MPDLFKYKCQRCNCLWVWRYSFTVACPECKKRAGFLQSMVEGILMQESALDDEGFLCLVVNSFQIPQEFQSLIDEP
jgi:hypothetical protein